MSKQVSSELIKKVMVRFNDDYFIRAMGVHGYFCVPNFMFNVVEGRLQIQLLSHVSPDDEAEIRTRLAGLPYQILPERLSLEELTQQTGIDLP